MFHLDEYIGLPATHPASFRLYLTRQLIERVHPGRVYLIEGDASDIEAERRRLNHLLRDREVDVAFAGIGENGHLAFNDPPADFAVDDPYLVVALDAACRRQQVNEGWFAAMEDVPRQAVSMSIKQIMRARAIIGVVPDRRKAQAVFDCFTGDVSPLHPASILRHHDRAYVFLDGESAAMLPGQTEN
jgi:glucosamine-6-phosphate deaminase